MKIFETFVDALAYSKELAKKLNKFIVVKRKGRRFVVPNDDNNSTISDKENESSITYDNIPSQYSVLKKTGEKAVLKTPNGKVITVWKNNVPIIKEPNYGDQTRTWERHKTGVTNWEYDK